MAGNPGQVACDLFVVRLFRWSARLLKIQPGQLFFQLFAAASKSFLGCHGRFLLFYAIKQYITVFLFVEEMFMRKRERHPAEKTQLPVFTLLLGASRGETCVPARQDYDFFRKSGGMRVLRCEVQTGEVRYEKRRGLALLGLVINTGFFCPHRFRCMQRTRVHGQWRG